MKREQKAVCTIGLIIINVGMFLLFMLFDKAGGASFLFERGVMYEPYVIEGKEYYRLVTSLFLHFGIDHLLNNMVLLGALGWNLEPETGKIRFLLIYFISGVGGNILSLILNHYYGRSVISAGASGAIFGLMGALLCVVIRNKGHIGRLSGRGMLFMVILSLYFGFTSTGVDNAAHIGGLVCGFLVEAILGALW